MRLQSRRTRRAHRLDASEFRKLFEETPEGVFISGVDGRWIDVNPAGCEMLGYPREELVGRRIVDFIAPEDARWWIDLYESVRLERSSATLEHGFRRKGGSIFYVEVTAKWYRDGRLYAFVRDISARKRVERERDDALRWLRAALEQCPVGLLLRHAPDGEHFEVNARAQRMLGGSTRVRNGPVTFFTPDGRPLLPDEFPGRRALRGERVIDEELLERGEDGALVPLLVSAAPILDPKNAILGAIVTLQDISAGKELERLRAEWSAVVAHDLQQPLSSISLNAQLLANRSAEPEVRKRADEIRAASSRLSRMVGDLTDLSRLEARRLELVRRRVDLTALVRAAVERIELSAEERPFEVRIRGVVPEVDADPDRIAQVVENLLTNALKYGKANTPVVLTVDREGDAVATAVTNAGRPLAAEEIARIFERFQRTASAKLEGIRGAGLGLYISRSIVEAHGGRIWAESTPDGLNTFRFTLPAAAAEHLAAASSTIAG